MEQTNNLIFVHNDIQNNRITVGKIFMLLLFGGMITLHILVRSFWLNRLSEIIVFIFILAYIKATRNEIVRIVANESEIIFFKRKNLNLPFSTMMYSQITFGSNHNTLKIAGYGKIITLSKNKFGKLEELSSTIESKGVKKTKINLIKKPNNGTGSLAWAILDIFVTWIK